MKYSAFSSRRISLLSLWFIDLFVIFSLLAVSELFTEVHITSYIVSILIIFSIILSQRMKKTEKSVAVKALAIFTAAIVVLSFIHIILNIYNVYEITKQESVLAYCQTNQELCNITKDIFFGLKIYRFITLSTLFFSWLLFGSILNLVSLKCRASIPIKRMTGLQKVFYFYIATLILAQSMAVVTDFYSFFITIPREISVPFADRFVSRMGGNQSNGWVYTYAQFINEHTSPGAIILIPPKKDSWEMEGNAGYIRWFIYPRETLSASELTPLIPENAEYVMISYGTWWSEIHGWPRGTIPADKINKLWLINRQTLVQTELPSTSYEYTDGVEQWGLIELKK